MDEEALTRAHHRLLAEIADETRLTRALTGRAHLSQAVLDAMARVARHHFVRPQDLPVAYADRPQSIGYGQTISQPFMVAIMTELLELAPTHRVLEIGAGSGYQAAVLAEVAGRVYTVEVIEALAAEVRDRLSGLGYDKVEVRHGDGFAGWPEEAPFDAVMVTAAPEGIPQDLVDQLKVGGRMVIPIGQVHAPQTLYLGVKDASGTLTTEPVLPVAFVPMVAAPRDADDSA